MCLITGSSVPCFFCSNSHVVDAKVLILLVGALVDLNLDLRVVLWRIWVINETVGEGVIEHQSEWLLSFAQFSQIVQELHKDLAVSAVSAAKWIAIAQVTVNLLKEALHSGVATSKSSRLQSKVKLDDLQAA